MVACGRRQCCHANRPLRRVTRRGKSCWAGMQPEDEPWDVDPMSDGAESSVWLDQLADSSSPSSPRSDRSGDYLGVSSDEASTSDAGAVRWSPFMDTLGPAQNPQLMAPSPLLVPGVPAAAPPPVQLPPGPLVQLPPAPPSAGPRPKRHRSDAAAGGAAAGSPSLRHLDDTMSIETVLEYLSTQPEHSRPEWMLPDGSDPQRLRGGFYIEHGRKRRGNGTDKWKITSSTKKRPWV